MPITLPVVPPAPISFEWTLSLSLGEWRSMRSFFRTHRVTCRKCAALSAGQRSTTRAHHRGCQKRGGLHRGREQQAHGIEYSGKVLGLVLHVRRGRGAGVSLIEATARCEIAIKGFDSSRAGLAATAGLICGAPCDVDSTDPGIVRVVPSKPLGEEALERLRLGLSPHLLVGTRLEVSDV